MAHRQQRERVIAVLSALSDVDQRCIHLRGTGLRYREIAEVLGISLGSVAKSLTRSIALCSAPLGANAWLTKYDIRPIAICCCLPTTA